MKSIKIQLLSRCIGIFHYIALEPASDVYGTPPQVYYIDFGYGDKEELEMFHPHPQETYRYDRGLVERVKVGTKNKIKPVSGMYFPEGHGSVGIRNDNKYGYICFAVGPRYGRGFRYKIIDDEEGFKLGDEELIWMS